MDPFLASMTFAGGVERECDCDECDSCGLSMVPPDIKNAIRDYKRRKVMSIIDFSRQERKVIARSENGCSIYHYAFPRGADPLVEYGDSHRIILVDKLPKGADLKRIGSGIVGSKAEEESRASLHWEEGNAYMVPSVGGRAVGFVYPSAERDKDEKEEPMSVAIYVFKVTPDRLKHIRDGSASDSQEPLSTWVVKMSDITARALLSSADRALRGKDSVPFIPLPSNAFASLKEELKTLHKATS